MKLPDVRIKLQHIITSGEAIQEYVRGVTYREYVEDHMRQDAVERRFGIIGEALREAIRLDPATAAQISKASDIIAFRNVITHDYEAIWSQVVWTIAHDDLPRLLDEVRALLLR